MGKRKTNDEWFNLFNKKYDYKYDYINIIYIDNRRYVLFKCEKHGDLKQRVEQHLKGYGCRKCYDIERKTTNYFDIVNNIHNNFYIYNDDYKDTRTKIKITCPIHGDFYKYPHHHKNGDGCCECKKEQKFKEKWEETKIKANKIHKNKFDYSISNYNGYHNNIDIICPIHGKFTTTVVIHLNGYDCKKCTIDTQRKSHTQFIFEASNTHNYYYDYPQEYIDSHSEITIICPIHGEFKQSPHNHLHNTQGCPKCNRSNGEIKIENILLKNNIPYQIEQRFKDCKYKQSLPFDFYLPNHNMCIEYDGEQHFRANENWGGEKALKLQQIKDKIKDKYCKDNNIKLLRIRYDENTEEVLINFLKENDII